MTTPTAQEQLIHLVNELHEAASCSYKISDDEVLRAFASAFHTFSRKLKERLDEWSSLDEESIKKLKQGTGDYPLDIELIDDLAGLLLDEFANSLQQHEISYAENIRDLCGQIRALLNQCMQRPSDMRLSSTLDAPDKRMALSVQLDNLLCTPVREMIEKIEHLLKSENLGVHQRECLEAALRSSHRLYRVLQTARPLVETQNFRALAKLSHDYRSPFCGLTGFFLLLLKIENQGLSVFELDQLRELADNSYTVLGMVNDLLDTTRILAGEDVSNRKISLSQNVNLSQEKEKFLKSIEVYRQSSPQLSIDVEIADDLPNINLSGFYFWDCFRPLIRNACKYTPQGRICLTILQEDDFILVHIQDTGIGIAEEDQQRIFEPFVQVGEQSKGLGLGLFLARQHAEAAGGSLTVESQVGVGSTFTLRLPILMENVADEQQESHI